MISNQISLRPSLVVRILWAVASLLVLISVAGQLTVYFTGCSVDHWLVKLFNVGCEHNMPTLFSAFLLTFAALLLAVIAVLERKRNASGVSYWAILSLGFVFMTVDDLFALHERLVEPIRGLLGGGNLGFFHFAWVIPGIALVLVLALFFLRFWLRLPSKTRFIFLVAASIYLGGSIGFELIGGYCVEEIQESRPLTFIMIETIEESLEMAGVIIFIWGLLKYIADNYKEVRFRFDGISEKE
ncbi:MAG: hypothetical protein NTW65_10385 [Deltaproteobacteria bacterium]|nr:hypothetical protein [Deltaproteobacteria bacterium]